MNEACQCGSHGEGLSHTRPACPFDVALDWVTEQGNPVCGLAGWAMLGSGHVLMCCMDDLSS